MVTVYMSVIMLCRIVQAIYGKKTSNEINSVPLLFGYSAYKNAISAFFGLLIIVLSRNGFKIDLLTLIIALFSGINLFLSGYCSIYGMKTGTISLFSMFGTAGMIIPLIAGVVLFQSPISYIQWLGVLLFFISAWLLIASSKKIYNKYSFKTFLFLIGSMVSNGCTMLAQQMFTAYVPNGDVSIFSFISFGVIAIFGGLTYLLLNNKSSANKSPQPKEKMSRVLLISGLALAVAVFLINQFATLSTKLLPPVILFTFVNGGGTIISTIVAAILYREKLSAKSTAGVLLGIASLVIIKMF